jgi:RNA polymerase sigma-70 factor (ECF subfamily)
MRVDTRIGASGSWTACDGRRRAPDRHDAYSDRSSNRNAVAGYSPPWTRRKGNVGSQRSQGEAATAAEELALMAGVAAARMDAFKALYLLYQPRLARFLQRTTRQPDLVEEVLDDTMMVVWRRAHTFVPTGKVSTWIFGIAYRQALKALRQAGDARLEYRDGDPGTADEDADPGELVLRQQQRDRIGQALDALSVEQRAVVEMTYFLGYSCRDVAEVMGCPVDTVKTRMFYARKRLRGLLGTWEEAV